MRKKGFDEDLVARLRDEAGPGCRYTLANLLRVAANRIEELHRKLYPVCDDKFDRDIEQYYSEDGEK